MDYVDRLIKKEHYYSLHPFVKITHKYISSRFILCSNKKGINTLSKSFHYIIQLRN